MCKPNREFWNQITDDAIALIGHRWHDLRIFAPAIRKRLRADARVVVATENGVELVRIALPPGVCRGCGGNFSYALPGGVCEECEVDHD